MKMGETQPNYYKDAIDFHTKHKEVADVAGKFLAHINLGIIYNAVGDFEKSSINHQFALRYAIQMSSVAGQSVAIGNLGKVGGKETYAQMNQEKLQMFVERYLELSNELKYRKGESGAFMQLGELLTQKGDFETSTKHFYRAMKIAEDTEDRDIKDTAKVNFGMANASMKWQDHVTDILKGIEGNEKAANAEEDREDVIERDSEDEEEKDDQWRLIAF